MQYGCIGKKLTHSFSKEIHNLLSNYQYELKEIPENELDAFMEQKDFRAINVTIPYKQAVIPHLDYIDNQAKIIGAVNTIVNKNGKLFGYNTDFFGMSELIKKLGVDINGKKVLILGTGGTSLTARNVVKSMNAGKIILVSRAKTLDTVTYEQAEKNHSDTDVIINTTPLGMYPEIEGTPINIKAFKNLCGVVDAIYNPLNSTLVLTAKNSGIPAEGGLYMLVMQAALAVEKFLDVELDKTAVQKVYNDILKSKQNIVLTGMPGCGKTTIGKKVAQLLNREFIDTDDEIVKYSGMSIPEIFEQKGEEEFRKIEKTVIAEVSKRSGVVVSTGGGAVLKQENVFHLRQNGELYFINRKLKHITATRGRPLSSGIEKIKQIYNDRIDIYKNTADKIIEPVFSIEENAKMIAEDFLNEDFSD